MFRAATLVTSLLAAYSSFSSSNDTVENDAGADAPTGADAANVDGAAWVPCALREAGPAHFCADFDGIDDVRFGWTRQEVALGGAVGLTDAGAVSPPQAYVA